METKFTKGEWQVSKLMNAKTVKSKQYGCICLMDFERNEEIEPNANLIAAAPMLLEALIGTAKALQRVLYIYNPDSIEHEWIGEAQEAIIKATGNNLND
jgi:hypothetical protein